jgi:hypothetical protein
MGVSHLFILFASAKYAYSGDSVTISVGVRE